MARARANKLVDLKLELRMLSPKAYGVIDGSTEIINNKKKLKLFWLPKSVTECSEKDPVIGQQYEFTMPEWIAVDKGLV